jgi:hypothetical protein
LLQVDVGEIGFGGVFQHVWTVIRLIYMEFYHKWGIAKDPQDAANLVEREVRRRRRRLWQRRRQSRTRMPEGIHGRYCCCWSNSRWIGKGRLAGRRKGRSSLGNWLRRSRRRVRRVPSTAERPWLLLLLAASGLLRWTNLAINSQAPLTTYRLGCFTRVLRKSSEKDKKFFLGVKDNSWCPCLSEKTILHFSSFGSVSCPVRKRIAQLWWSQSLMMDFISNVRTSLKSPSSGSTLSSWLPRLGWNYIGTSEEDQRTNSQRLRNFYTEMAVQHWLG